MPIADWQTYPPPLYINIGFGLSSYLKKIIIQDFIFRQLTTTLTSWQLHSTKMILLTISFQHYRSVISFQLWGILSWSGIPTLSPALIVRKLVLSETCSYCPETAETCSKSDRYNKLKHFASIFCQNRTWVYLTKRIMLLFLQLNKKVSVWELLVMVSTVTTAL